MSHDLPLGYSDYKASLLITDFISKTKKELEKSSTISDIHFIPKTNGYDITFKSNGNSFRIELNISRSLFNKNKLKVKFFQGDTLERSFNSDNTDKSIAVLKSFLSEF